MPRRSIRTLTKALALAVGLSTWTGTGVAAVAVAQPPLVAMTATFTAHDPGYPTGSPPPARQLVSATLTQDIHHGKVEAKVQLGAAPSAATDATLVVVFGFVEGDDCRLAGDYAQYEFPTVGTSGDGITYDGATITLDRKSAYSLIDAWTCAGVALLGPTAPPYDAMSGDLAPVYGQPVLAVSGEAPVKAVPGDWATVHVTVSNTLDSPMDAAQTTLKAHGKGLKVRRLPTIGTLKAGETREVELEVMLSGRRSRSLTLTATSGAVVATSTVPVRKVRAAKAPVPGKYSMKSARGSFRIAHGKVTGLSTRVFITCGGPAAPPTYEVREVRFPATRIPRSGLVDAVFRRAGARIDLSMKVSGAKVTRGDIQYSLGAPICYGGNEFTAKRR